MDAGAPRKGRGAGDRDRQVEAVDDREGDSLDRDIPRDDGLHTGILRLKPDAPVLAEEALHGRFILHPRDHDIAVLRGLLPADDEHVTVKDPGVDHAVAPDFEDEALLRSE